MLGSQDRISPVLCQQFISILLTRVPAERELCLPIAPRLGVRSARYASYRSNEKNSEDGLRSDNTFHPACTLSNITLNLAVKGPN